jgi:DNA repair exonuclease SbcCD ATPase subunit
MFQSMLACELDEMITETILSYQHIKQQKRSLHHAIKHELEQTEEEMAPLSQKNLEFRRDLARLRSRADASQAKLRHIAEAQSIRSGEVKARMAQASPLLLGTKNELESIAMSLTSLGQQLSSFEVAEQSGRAARHWRAYIDRLKRVNPLEHFQFDLLAQRQITTGLSQSIGFLCKFVASSDSEVPRDFREQLRGRIANGRRTAIMVTVPQIVSRMTRLVERKTNEYTERFRRQKLQMERLKHELAKAETRLAQLLTHNGAREKQIMGELEQSHMVLKRTQTQTDRLMIKLFGEGLDEVASTASLSESLIFQKSPRSREARPPLRNGGH